jgi:diguanylate cyclase (GGDEF)-like protein
VARKLGEFKGLRVISKFLSVPKDKPALVLAQFQAFTKQVPLLYFVLVTNMVFVALTHYQVTPLWLSLGFPAVFGTAAVLRCLRWWRGRNNQVTAEVAAYQLTSTIWLSAVFSVMLITWCFGLLQYGDDLLHAHVGFFMAVTVVGCILCLMHLKCAAYLVTLIVCAPFCIAFILMDRLVLNAMSINMAIVAVVLLYMLTRHYNDFARMVQQRADLEVTHANTLRLNEENYNLANRDPLTGLPNRRSFLAKIADLTQSENGDHFMLGLIDLDGFKAVNDLYGHGAGDQLLVEVSSRMKLTVAADFHLARLGGDEFGFTVAHGTDAKVIAATFCEVLRQPFKLGAVTAQIAASCGLAQYPESAGTANELMEFADYALYQSKASNQGVPVVFTNSHRDEIRFAHQVDQALRNADLENEMRLVYQPVTDVASGEIVSSEALARWSNTLLGEVSPGKFIVAAERSPIINTITLMLLRKLLKDLDCQPNMRKVSFNLSSRSLASPETMLQLVSLIHQSKIDPKRIEFEVTETALLLDFELALRSLVLLRNLGSSIALDDFGTGYSSLSYIHRLPLDTIKIDRRFVTDMVDEKKAHDIVKTIIGLSRDLNLRCVAEGVETQDQADMLEAAGCTTMQGYLFSKPITVVALNRMLQGEVPNRVMAG